MSDAPLDLADKKQVAARKLTQTQRDRRADEDLDFIMSTPAGRRFVARLMSLSPFNALSYQERRSICAEITVAVVRVSPAGYGLMMNESNEGN